MCLQLLSSVLFVRRHALIPALLLLLLLPSYMARMSFDVLAFVVIERLGLPGRPRVKHDGTNVQQWLQSLAAFCGGLFRKYHDTELRGVLQFVVEALVHNETTDLVVLQVWMHTHTRMRTHIHTRATLPTRLASPHSECVCMDALVVQELLARMGGKEVAEDISDDQILGQSGGPLLRAAATLTTQVTSSTARKAALKLKTALISVS